MTITSVFAPITKTVEQDDGSVTVYGKATDGALDGDMQRCDPAWLATAMPAWYMTGGNIREQHDPHRAIGKAIDHEDDGDGGHYITARIVDPVAVLKTKAGVFTGFSVGISRPKIDKTHPDTPAGIINGGNIVEISLCDRPSNPGCTITLAKAAKPGMEINAADFDSKRLLVRCEELIVKSDTPDQSSMKVTLADAIPPEQAKALADKATGSDSDGGDGGGDAAEKLAGPADPAELPPTVPTPIQPPAPPVDLPPADKAADPAETPAEPPAGDTAPVDGKAADVAPLPPNTPPVLTSNATGDAATALDATQKAVDGIATLNEARANLGLPKVFDAAAAKALVATVLEKWRAADLQKVDDGTDGPSDVLIASVAISMIARLIQSEAQDMVDCPDEDGDIRCLLEAVSALRWYIRRERTEGGAGGPSESAPMYYSATPDTVAAEIAADTTEKTDTPADPAPDATPEPVDTTTADPEVAKAATVSGNGDAPETVTADAIMKALAADLSKADNPFRTALETIVQASTEAITKSLAETTDRLAQVEQMAIPGGPARHRTESERTQARVRDLAAEVRKFQTLATATSDQDLQRGYAVKAARLEDELKALAPSN